MSTPDISFDRCWMSEDRLSCHADHGLSIAGHVCGHDFDLQATINALPLQNERMLETPEARSLAVLGKRLNGCVLDSADMVRNIVLDANFGWAMM